MLCDLGYKEIEVSFPSASQTDYDFTRRLIETPGAVPDDVFLQVLSPCQADLIQRTVEAARGARNVIVHVYLATSECFRRVAFGYEEEETVELAVECTRLVRGLTKGNLEETGTRWLFEFSPECFSDTEIDYAVRVCRTVRDAWEPDGERGDRIILNLPATVEMPTPNMYADLVEYLCGNIGWTGDVCVSLVSCIFGDSLALPCYNHVDGWQHPHNDRGTGKHIY